MVPTVPAFGGVPAGPELVIILMILVLLFGVPTVVIAGVVLFLKLRSDGEEADTDRIAELEAEVERLREKVDDERYEKDESDGDDHL
ncbi:protein translocase TatA [Halorubrum lacusprofundi]|jgi:sec-independent protein translocase protein TatA|uniref:Sec-independent protein translocase component TatA n=1 Tax=Halorubrum lacusprofundi (strain ATCC 49239 / DSM 5036 / JCM 8891 / ACAM 34) TaxID=416348 RepID=B9LS70_HALLT|nr:protein translocase TatA [Halorubrum lacusprofundi]ACM55915.1 sec-independent protein translocase component TatA [Halorubrum lacusprofundi ATCC 49239]MCG1006784.1 preprotein translocase subunit TatA [Halorubrum lacusprofundi]